MFPNYKSLSFEANPNRNMFSSQSIWSNLFDSFHWNILIIPVQIGYIWVVMQTECDLKNIFMHFKEKRTHCQEAKRRKKDWLIFITRWIYHDNKHCRKLFGDDVWKYIPLEWQTLKYLHFLNHMNEEKNNERQRNTNVHRQHTWRKKRTGKAKSQCCTQI